MKSNRVILGLAIVLVTAGIAIAQSVRGDETDSRTLLTQTVCTTNFNTVKEQLRQNYGEVPFGSSETHMDYFTTDGKRATVTGKGVFFLNPSSRTYTMVLWLRDNTACVLGSGMSFSPYADETPAEENKQENDVEKIEIKNGRYTST